MDYYNPPYGKFITTLEEVFYAVILMDLLIYFTL